MHDQDDDKEKFEPFDNTEEELPTTGETAEDSPDALIEDDDERDTEDDDEAAEPEPDLRYAGLNRRMLSSTIDLMVMILMLMPAASLLMRGERVPPAHPLFWQEFVVGHVNYISFFAVYSLVFWSLYATSPGKWLTGLRIIDSTTGEAPARRAFFKRAIGYVIPGLVSVIIFTVMGMHVAMAEAFQADVVAKVLAIMTVFGAIGSAGFLMIAFSRQKRGLHDRLAGTAVIIDYSHYKRLFRAIMHRIRPEADAENTDK